MTSQAVACADRAENTVKTLITQNWAAIAGALPQTMEPKRFARLVANSVRKTPLLAEATAVSMVGSLLAASTLGLEVDTPLGEAYLIPYKRKNRQRGTEWVEAQLIPGYQGIVKLFLQHPLALQVESGWIGEHDVLSYGTGSDKHLKHTPKLVDRGKPIGVWALYRLTTGAWDYVVLSMEQVAALRGKSLDEKRDVADPEHWMERKTALKQVLKLAPKSTHLVSAMKLDDEPVAAVVEQVEMRPVADAMRAVGAGDVNLSTVEGETVDPDTGELVAAPEPADEPDQPDQSLLKRSTGEMIVREFDRLSVERSQIGGWLPALGLDVDQLGKLPEQVGRELQARLRKMSRDDLAALAMGGQ